MASGRRPLTPGTARLQRAILCLLSVAFAGYLLYWFMFALDNERMERVEQWGVEHGIALYVKRKGGDGSYVSPGRVWHPQDLDLSDLSP